MPKFQFSRSVLIEAPAKQVFEAIADFKNWSAWSPWMIIEPEAKVTLSGNSSSVGSNYHWNGEVTGEGNMRHCKLEPNSLIEIDLNFIKAFKSHADIKFHLVPVGQGIQVTWHMDSSLPFFLFFMVPMVKTLVGMDFARGLTMLKEWVETGVVTSKSKVHGIEQAQPFSMLGVAASCSIDEVITSMQKTAGEAQAAFQRAGIAMDGEMLSVYTKFRVKEGIFEYISGFIVPPDVQVSSASKLRRWELPACKVFRVEHVGSYKHLGNPWGIANQIVRFRKLKQSKVGTFEIYRKVPPAPEAELVTDIYLPLK